MQIQKLKTVDADTLLSTPIRKTLFVVDGLIPQGLSVLSGPSKIGKSWLMLWLALQVSRGEPVWEFLSHRCGVLYLCLEDKEICGNSYNYAHDGYVFVDEMGDRIKPNWLTVTFPYFVEKHGLPRMRFHDLRHSCASLLLANGVPLKQIQEWLGHSDFSTTANIYAHLDYTSKLSSAQAMVDGIALPQADHFGSRWDRIAEKG